MFHDVTMPFRSLLTIASSDDSTIAPSRSAATLGLLPLADVPRDLRCANHLARCVANGRHRERDVDEPPVLGLANRFEMLDGKPGANPAEDEILFRQPGGWNDRGNRPADDLLGGVAEQALRRRVPRRHDAIEIFADDGVVGRLHDRGEAQLRELGHPPFAEVARDRSMRRSPAPMLLRMGEIVNDTSMRLPSFATTIVSKWGTSSPFHTRSSVAISSSRLSGGNSLSVDWPTASAAVYPSSRSAALFHKVIVPSRSCAMIASSDDDTIAARYASAAATMCFDISGHYRS